MSDFSLFQRPVREYQIENNQPVNTDKLKAERMSDVDYQVAHENLVIPCHDVFIRYNEGILLVNRLNYPAKNSYWPIGGRIQRGMGIEDSLKETAKREANLELYDLFFMGVARAMFQTDPFNHGKGTDTLGVMYFAKGKGELKPDTYHSHPILITPKNYNEYMHVMGAGVHDFLAVAMHHTKWK